ncbi:MAG: twin-arginine translocation signal domain-containing protein, partial [Nitrososphaerales archaeon]
MRVGRFSMTDLDGLTKTIALRISRRSFLKGVAALTSAVGLAVGIPGQVKA